MVSFDWGGGEFVSFVVVKSFGRARVSASLASGSARGAHRSMGGVL